MIPLKNTKAISVNSIGFLFALASACLFAIRPIFVKLVYAEGIDPSTLIAFRMLFSAPIYAVMLYFLMRQTELRNKITKKAVASSAFIGLFGYYGASFLDLVGLQYVTAQLGRMILYIYPTLTVILGAILFREHISLRTIICLIVTYIGVAIIFGHDLQYFGKQLYVGAAFIIGSALSFAIYLIYSKPLISQLGSRTFTCIALLSASTGIFIHYAVTHSVMSPQLNTVGLFWILIIAIFCTVIPSFFTTAAVARIGANKTGIVAMVGPGVTSIFAVLILDELFSIYHALGIVITVAGVWYLHQEKAKAN